MEEASNRRWRNAESIDCIEVSIAENQLEHILERTREYKLTFGDIDLVLRNGEISEGRGFDRRRNRLGDYRLRVVYGRIGIIASGGIYEYTLYPLLSKVEDLYHPVMRIARIEIRTVYRNKKGGNVNRALKVGSKRKVKYLFDTRLLDLR